MIKLDAIYQKLAPVINQHQTLTVVGGNWGDEGKGKVIDLVMKFYEAAVRFSGGANAGHTVYTNDNPSTQFTSSEVERLGARKIVSHLIPSGLAQNKICVLGRGEFFNAELFLKELAEIKAALSPSENPLPNPPHKGEGNKELAPIYVDQQAPLWTPYHRLFEAYTEIMRGEKKIGTTNKGIGPLEGLYKLRLAPVVGQLFSPDVLMAVLKSLYAVLKPCFDYVKSQNLMPDAVPAPETVRDELLAFAENIKPFVADTSFLLNKMLSEGKKLLFEGAQATGLDAFWGTYPFVSSGNSVSQGAALGTGLPMSKFDAVIVVCKTLPTRVGMGPFPSEMWERQAAMNFAKENPELFEKAKSEHLIPEPARPVVCRFIGCTTGVEGSNAASKISVRDEFLSKRLKKINAGQASRAEMSQYFQVLGDERGATTGRGRSLGFLDIPWLQYAVRINGPRYLALTRFDMLSGVKNVPVVVGYKLDGQLMAKGQVPPPWRIAEVETVMETWAGFAENIYGISEFNELPANAQTFIKKIEAMMGVPILLIGTGPERDSVVVKT